MFAVDTKCYKISIFTALPTTYSNCNKSYTYIICYLNRGYTAYRVLSRMCTCTCVCDGDIGTRVWKQWNLSFWESWKIGVIPKVPCLASYWPKPLAYSLLSLLITLFQWSLFRPTYFVYGGHLFYKYKLNLDATKKITN